MRRHKIDLLRKTGSHLDENGNRVDEWAIAAGNVWADVKDVSGSKFYAENARHRRKLITANIAYRKDVDESMRLRFRGELYKVLRLYSGDYGNLTLNIDAELQGLVTD